MDVLATIGLLLPLAIAGAFSSVPIALVTVVLLSRRARANGTAHAIGFTAGTSLVTLALAAGIGHPLLPAERAHNPVVAVIEVVLGAILIARGILMAVRRPPAGCEGEEGTRPLRAARPGPSFSRSSIRPARPPGSPAHARASPPTAAF
ncbi:hypothetical protein B7R22_16290 [Subtercola boreus]|uniref:Uncharacterized protein n=1 Tax=Subtercola boreus TaxID=120213 RepID=A0A3E0VRV2_9MICO|nr:GAP family protein [Subtercola boreus]RFA12355.1 hypothetical protein B7R22_16290 [Subtercola boreus]